MTQRLVRGLAVGLGTLTLVGALGPTVAAAHAPTSDPSGPAASQSPAQSPSQSPSQAPSQSTTYQQHQTPFSLLVSPTRLVVGQRDLGRTQAMTLVNRGKDPLTVEISKRNFTSARDGSLRYEADAPYAAASWVHLSRTKVQIQPGRSEAVLVSVRQPATPEPGDHQVAVVFLVPAQGAPDGNIRINRGVAAPLYVAAPGPVVDSVRLSDLHAPHFVMGGSVPVTATVTNTGTVHHDFRSPSPLSVEAAGRAAAFPDFTVNRDSVRDIATTWQPPFVCVCHPTVTLTSADGGEQTQSVRVIVFPWPWFAAALGVLALAALAVRAGRRGFRAQVLKAAAAQRIEGGGDA